MGFRFQKRIKIAPGITINLSKSGVSTSVGPRGARMTFGRGKIRTTVGIPGSGISHTQTHDSGSDTEPGVSVGSVIIILIVVALVLSYL